ncbi:MAG: Gfo/Idh/MocA family oxidoreductase [Solobacterium sp.]|nr:Gfo/Idh/MocA family oxidoreductase [Solobacterium sp.]
MIRWGILGAGNIAHRFAKSLQYEEDAVLYAISGRSQEKLDRFAEEFPCEKKYVGHDLLIGDPDVDAIYLALPHGMHAEWAVKALAAGKPVLCEKPAAVSEEETAAIIQCAKENHVLFMEAMKPRFLPAYQEIKKQLAEGMIGEVEKIFTKICFALPKEAIGKSYHTSGDKGSGALLDSGIYCVNLIEDLLKGEPVFEQTYANYYNGVDWYVDSMMKFANGCAEMEVAFDRSAPRNAEIYGSEGSITIVDLHRPSTWIVHKNGKDETFTAPYVNDDFYGQIHHFDELIRQGKAESDVMPYDAILREAHILECIRSQYTQYDENDLKVLAGQEEELSVSSFHSEDARKLGNTIAELAKEYDRPVAIRIDRCEDGLTLYQYMMDGKTSANLKYMDGKKQSVLDSGHSSAWVYVKLMADNELAAWRNDGVHLISGGAFPLYMDGRIVAVVQVSGLHEGKDHELIVRSVSAAFGKEFTPFRKALG